jgi:cardiolipin synthase
MVFLTFTNRNFLKQLNIVFFGSLFILSVAGCSPLSDTIPKDVDVSDINKALDENTDTHRDAGSDMQLMVEGEKTYQAMIDLINSAQDHINLESLNFDTDDEQEQKLGLEIAKLLVEKVNQGIPVNVILDPVFQKYLAEPVAVNMLTQGGANVRYFMPPLDRILIDQILYRTHKKILIADGRQAITGGSNYGSRYLSADQWRDTNVRLTGPVVASIQREFLRDWNALGDPVADETRYFPTLEAIGTLSIRSIDNRPAEEDGDINQAVLIAIQAAVQDIVIETPYFNPPQWLSDALANAVARGVRVRVLTNSETSTDAAPMYWSSEIHFADLLNKGIEIYLWNRDQRTIHSKVMICDDKMAMITSYNFSHRSIMWDAENGVIFTDAEPIRQIREMLENDLSRDFIFKIEKNWNNLEMLRNSSILEFTSRFGWLF